MIVKDYNTANTDPFHCDYNGTKITFEWQNMNIFNTENCHWTKAHWVKNIVDCQWSAECKHHSIHCVTCLKSCDCTSKILTFNNIPFREHPQRLTHRGSRLKVDCGFNLCMMFLLSVPDKYFFFILKNYISFCKHVWKVCQIQKEC